jgi:ribose-phosphate pyrophosphokinase
MLETTLDLTREQAFRQNGGLLRYRKSTFPAGEQYIKIFNDAKLTSVRVNARCGSSEDLMTIILAVDALKVAGFTEIELFLPYFPYARQDRVCSEGESFSLRTICKIFNMLNLTRIITYDIHSEVTGILLERHENYDNHTEVRAFMEAYVSKGREAIALIVPDNGAYRKAERLFTSHPHIFDTMVVCQKKRTENGIVVNPIKENLRGMKCVVVDDICDGGATFMALGQRLLEAKAKKSYLFVSHGIFSRGLPRIQKFYDLIGTSNSIWQDRNVDFKKVYNLHY